MYRKTTQNMQTISRCQIHSYQAFLLVIISVLVCQADRQFFSKTVFIVALNCDFYLHIELIDKERQFPDTICKKSKKLLQARSALWMSPCSCFIFLTHCECFVLNFSFCYFLSPLIEGVLPLWDLISLGDNRVVEIWK